GVHVIAGVGDTISGNSIFSNLGYYALEHAGQCFGAPFCPPDVTGHHDDGLGIELGYSVSWTAGLRNEPVLTSVSSAAGGMVNVTGTLNASPNQTYTVEFFSNEQEGKQGFGQGQHFLTSATVYTNDSGYALITASLAGVDPTQTPFITATATDATG